MSQRQPEGKIKDACRVIAKSAGLLFWNIEGKSTNGVPDTLCTNHLGRVVMVEFKVPGKQPNDQQWLRIYDLREQGVSAWYATSVQEWEMLVGLRPNTIEFVYPPHVVKLIELGTTAAQARGHKKLNTGTWTTDQVATLKRLWSDGKTSTYIASCVSKTRNQVIAKAHQLDLR